MAAPSTRAIVAALLRLHGRTYAEELGIAVDKNSPAGLFRLLCMALLYSARIRASVARSAARALIGQGWTTPAKMAAASWEARTHTLNRAGYARYDGRTSTMLGDTAHLLLQRYGGDLRRLREAAGRDPARERALLKDFKGIGEVGADIFFREVQTAWPELRPFADARALQGAARLGLPQNARALAALVPPAEFPRLVAGLVRMQLEGDPEQVLAQAAGG